MTAAETWEGPRTPLLTLFAQTFGGPEQKAWRSVPYTPLGLSLLVLKAGPVMAWVTWAFSGGSDSRWGSSRASSGPQPPPLTRATPLPRPTSAPETISAGPWEAPGPPHRGRRGERWAGQSVRSPWRAPPGAASVDSVSPAAACPGPGGGRSLLEGTGGLSQPEEGLSRHHLPQEPQKSPRPTPHRAAPPAWATFVRWLG